MKNLSVLTIILMTFVLFSCSKSENEICIEVNYDEKFSIEEGKEYCFPDESVLKIVAFRNEFCPCNVICVWEGQMVVEMEWQAVGDSTYFFDYLSSNNTNFPTNFPSGLEITEEDEDIVFEDDCTESNPSPDILEAKIIVSK